jgi:hypothetical protein
MEQRSLGQFANAAAQQAGMKRTLLGDESIVEHSHGLVRPQSTHGISGGALFGLNHQHALEHLADVTQVERVVRLLRRRFHAHADVVVHLTNKRISKQAQQQSQKKHAMNE